jgi:hypothetical protein
MFQTQRDLDNECAVIKECCDKWRCKARKQPCPPYKVDWLLLRNNVGIALAEVKCRAVRYDPYLIGLHKYEALTQLARASRLPGLIIVRWHGKGIFWINVMKAEHEGIRWMQDNRRREEADGEACVALETDRFQALYD